MIRVAISPTEAKNLKELARWVHRDAGERQHDLDPTVNTIFEKEIPDIIQACQTIDTPIPCNSLRIKLQEFDSKRSSGDIDRAYAHALGAISDILMESLKSGYDVSHIINGRFRPDTPFNLNKPLNEDDFKTLSDWLVKYIGRGIVEQQRLQIRRD